MIDFADLIQRFRKHGNEGTLAVEYIPDPNIPLGKILNGYIFALQKLINSI